jgi:hypothetical protein
MSIYSLPGLPRGLGFWSRGEVMDGQEGSRVGEGELGQRRAMTGGSRCQ